MYLISFVGTFYVGFSGGTATLLIFLFFNSDASFFGDPLLKKKLNLVWKKHLEIVVRVFILKLVDISCLELNEEAVPKSTYIFRHFFCAYVIGTFDEFIVGTVILLSFNYFIKVFYQRVSCKLYKFRVDSHLCKLRIPPVFVCLDH